MNKIKDSSLIPNAPFIENVKHKDQSIRPSSASLFDLDSLTKKTAKPVSIIPKKGNLKASSKYKYRDLLITVQGTSLEFDTTTSKVNNMILIKYWQSHDPKICITLPEYMQLTDTKKSSASMQLAKAANNLSGLTISRSNLSQLSQQQRKYEPFVEAITLYPTISYYRGKFTVRINDDFAAALDRARPMLFPLSAYKLNDTAYNLLDALYYYKQVNYHNSLSRQNKFKLGTLLERCSNLPSWESVKNGNRNYYARIVKPLKKALEELKNEIEYVFIDNEEKVQQGIDNLPLDSFRESYIVITKWKKLGAEQLKALKTRKDKGKKRKKKTS